MLGQGIQRKVRESVSEGKKYYIDCVSYHWLFISIFKAVWLGKLYLLSIFAESYLSNFHFFQDVQTTMINVVLMWMQVAIYLMVVSSIFLNFIQRKPSKK